MPVLILTALRVGKSVLGSKTGRICILVVAGVIVLGIAVWKIDEHGYDRAMAEVEKQTAAEHARREGVLKYMTDKWAPGAIQRVDELKAQNDALLLEINTKSADNNTKPALDVAAVKRLSLVRRQGGSGASRAAGATARPARR